MPQPLCNKSGALRLETAMNRHLYSVDLRNFCFFKFSPIRIGLCLQPGDVAVSLGTSDVVFAWLDDPKPILDGGVFCSAVDHNAYLAFAWSVVRFCRSSSRFLPRVLSFFF